MGYIVKRVRGYKLIEGIGRFGGLWIVKGYGELVKFNTRRDAEEHIEISLDLI